jgi:teichuronic acid biosynthesis glycosyltransferase TuaH
MLDLASSPSTPVHSTPPADVVYTWSYVTWRTSASRGWCHTEDRVGPSLLASPRVRRVLMCETSRSLPVKLISDRIKSAEIPFPADDRARLLTPVRLRRQDPATIRGITRTFRAYDRAMQRAASDMGLEDPVVITAHPLVAGFAELAWARAVTWYAVDDWALHPAYRRWWPAYREAYSRIRMLGRRVVAVTDTLRERLRPTGPSSVIPNGLDPNEWLGELSPPKWVDALPRPLLVYAGALDMRLKVDWLLELARAMPASSVVLVGPAPDPQLLAPLRGLRNIHIHGEVGRRDVSSLIRVADVGLLPHVYSALTTAMSPLKLYEYLAGGIPVAATDLPPIRQLADRRVSLVSRDGDFAEGVRAALAIGRVSETERRTFIDANSWQERHERMLDVALA